MAKALLNDKISTISNDTRYLVTSNIGCNMHISSALQNTIPELEILHPVTLLARQMNMPI
jgi:glycolate oxidase iron-sulfur subunit